MCNAELVFVRMEQTFQRWRGGVRFQPASHVQWKTIDFLDGSIGHAATEPSDG